MTGSFVLLVGNGRLSQTINHYLEARTNGRRLFRSLKPSAINFPSQVQWIDRGHRTHRIFHKRVPGHWNFRRSEDDFCPDAKRAPGLQYGSGGPDTGVIVSKRATHRPHVVPHATDFEKLVCIKLNSAGNPGS